MTDNRRPFGVPRWLRLTLGLLLVAASLYFLLSRLVRDWNQIPFDKLHFSAIWLVASFAVLVFAHFPIYGWLWSSILRTLGARVPVLRATVVTAVSNVGKYAPGKVWFTVGRMALVKSYGVSEAKCLASVVLEIIITLLGGVILLGFAVLLLPASQVPWPVYSLFLLTPLCLVLLIPKVFNRLLAVGLRWFRQPPFELRLPFSSLLGLVGICLLDWVAQGVGSYLLLRSFYPLPLSSLPTLLGGYAISWMIGFLVLVVPAGLGVRESIYTIVLKMAIPGPLAVIAALTTRVWQTLGELLAALIGLALLRAVKWRNDG